MDNETIAYIELLGLTLSGANAPTDGLYWTDLEGWWGLPDLKSDGDSIPGAHGKFPKATHERESRVITLTGHILVDTVGGLAATRTRLESYLAESAGDMTVVTSAYGSWTRYVEIDTVQIDPDHGRTWTKFTVDMEAPDPIRYLAPTVIGPIGLPVHEGGLILPQAFPWDFGTSTRPVATVLNTGSIPILPIVTMRSSEPNGVASADAITIFGGSRRLEFGQFSGVLVFDALERRAWLNGTDVTIQMIRRDWPSVAKGESADFYFEATNPSPDLTLSVEYQIGEW